MTTVVETFSRRLISLRTAFVFTTLVFPRSAWAGDCREVLSALLQGSRVATLTEFKNSLRHPVVRRFTDVKKFPGGSGGLETLETLQLAKGAEPLSGEALITARLPEGKLPYPLTGPRPSQPLQPVQEVDPKELRLCGLIFLGSEEHSGSSAVAQLAYYKGEPVIVKTTFLPPSLYDTAEEDRDESERGQQEEAKRWQYFSDLGVAPKFYGTMPHPTYKYRDDKTPRTALVMRIAPGDFPSKMGDKITPKTFEDLEWIIGHFPENHVLGDFQYFVTPSGRILVIDPIEPPPKGAKGSSHGHDHTRIRKELVRAAEATPRETYFVSLYQKDRPAFDDLYNDLTGPFDRAKSQEIIKQMELIARGVLPPKER